MAGTTDGAREVQYITQGFRFASDGVKTLADMLYKLMLLRKEDPINKALADALKNGDAAVFEVGSLDEAQKLKRLLAKNGVEITSSAQVGDRVYIVVPKTDIEKASQVVQDFYGAQTNGLYSSGYITRYANGDVLDMEGFTEEETFLLIQRCKEHGVPVCVDGDNAGGYRIRYAAKDQDAVDRIRLDTAMDLRGPAGEAYLAQIRWTLHYGKEIRNAAVRGEYLDGTPLENGSALVGADGKRVEFTKNYIFLDEGDGSPARRIFRDAKDAEREKGMQQVALFVKGMDTAVFMDAETYREYGEGERMRGQSPEDLAKWRQQSFARQERAGFMLPPGIYKHMLEKNALMGKNPDGLKFNKGDMLVSGNGYSLSFDGGSITALSPNGETRTAPEGTPEGRTLVGDTIFMMDRPVFLEAAEAEEYRAMDRDGKARYAKEKDVKTRTLVEGREQPSRENAEAIARSGAMYHEVEIRMRRDGAEVPAIEKMSYDRASSIFGLTKAEKEGFETSIQRAVVVAPTESEIEDLTDAVEKQYAFTSPHRPVLPPEKEKELDDILDGTPDYSLGTDEPDTTLDRAEYEFNELDYYMD